jgi:hypothetical protein
MCTSPLMPAGVRDQHQTHLGRCGPGSHQTSNPGRRAQRARPVASPRRATIYSGPLEITHGHKPARVQHASYVVNTRV